MASRCENHEAVLTSAKKIQLQTTKKEARARLFFSFNMKNQDTGLPALVVHSSMFQQVQMLR